MSRAFLPRLKGLISQASDWTQENPIGFMLLSAWRVFKAATLDIFEGELQVRAASLVYATLLALVPLIAVSFSVLKGFGVEGQMEIIIGDLFESIGDDKDAVVRQIMAFVSKVDVVALGAVGISVLFYTVFTLVRKIEASFNFCWRTSAMRSFGEGFPTYLSVILIGPVLLFAATTFSATISNEPLYQQISKYPGIASLIDWGGQLLPYGIMVLVFSGVLYFLPNTMVRIRAALVGGAVTAFLWVLVGQGFGWLVSSSGTYVAIYATFATMIIFMFWLFVVWLILLYGASIAFYTQNPSYAARARSPEEAEISGQARERIALMIMKDIARMHIRGETPPNVSVLSARLQIPLQSVDWVVSIMLRNRLLTATIASPRSFVPGRAADAITVRDIIDAVRSYGHDADQAQLHKRKDTDVEQVMTRLDRSRSRTLGTMTLRDLASPPGQKTAGQKTTDKTPAKKSEPKPKPETQQQPAGADQPAADEQSEDTPSTERTPE